MTEQNKSETLIKVFNIYFNYFESHVKQRFMFFNFYILVISSIMISFYILIKEKNDEFFVVPFLILLLVSFIFWKLDERCVFLIKHSEEVMKDIEKKLFFDEEGENLKLFSLEYKNTKDKRKQMSCISSYFFSYKNCIKFTYFGVTILALIFFMLQILR